MTVELKICIEAIKLCFFNAKSEELIGLLNSNVNYKKLEQLIAFHSLHPIFFKVFFDNNLKLGNQYLTEKINNIAKQNTLFSLIQLKETEQIITTLKDENIKAIPYKGSLFIKEIYDNHHLRESGDIDILVQPKEAIKALNKLLTSGYTNNTDSKIDFNSLLNKSNYHEFGVLKGSIHIDFHRGFHYPYLPYTLNYDSFFENTIEKTFLNKSVSVPNPYQIGSMLVLHNGGKELWLKFKHLIDLHLFIQKHSETLNWNIFLSILKEQKTYTIFLIGLYLLKKELNSNLPHELNSEIKHFKAKKAKSIIKYWDHAKHWGTLKDRISFERIFIGCQDKSFSRIVYLKKFVNFNSKKDYSRNIKGQAEGSQFGLKNFLAILINYLKK